MRRVSIGGRLDRAAACDPRPCCRELSQAEAGNTRELQPVATDGSVGAVGEVQIEEVHADVERV